MGWVCVDGCGVDDNSGDVDDEEDGCVEIGA